MSVRLSAASYAKVPAAEVNLMVVANLYLVPGSVYLMPGTNVDFHAEQIKSNKASFFLWVGPDQAKASLESILHLLCSHLQKFVLGKTDSGTLKIRLSNVIVGCHRCMKSSCLRHSTF